MQIHAACPSAMANDVALLLLSVYVKCDYKGPLGKHTLQLKVWSIGNQ